jgi:hypothetical protein
MSKSGLKENLHNSAIREGRHLKTSKSKKHSLGELIDRYWNDVLPTKKKCEQRQGSQVVWGKKQLGSYILSDITPAMIAEQRDTLLQGTTKQEKIKNPATAVRYMAALSHAFTIAIKEWGWIEDSPTSKVTNPKNHEAAFVF